MFDEKSDVEDEIKCPHCDSIGQGFVVNDYTMRHSREVLIECGICDKLYKVYYKFDKVVKLTEENHEQKG